MMLLKVETNQRYDYSARARICSETFKNQMLPNAYFYVLIITAQQYSLNCTGVFKGKIYQNIDKAK